MGASSIRVPGRNKKINKKKSLIPALIKESRKAIPQENKTLLYEKNSENEVITEEDLAAIKRGDQAMSLVDHLDEFRKRLIYCLGILIVLIITGFFLSDQILSYINNPINDTGHRLNIFKMTGGFMIRFKTSIIFSLILSIPIILYNIWKYIMPAVSKEYRKFSIKIIFSSFFLFYSGIAFIFFLVLPGALRVLLGFIGNEMVTKIGADDYVNFILLLSIAAGVLFEFPLIILIFSKLGIITPAFLISKRKYAILFIWIAVAAVSPPDIITQILIAVPVMFLYEISIVISKIIFLRKRRMMMIKK